MFGLKVLSYSVLLLLGLEILCRSLPFSLDGISSDYQNLNQIKIDSLYTNKDHCSGIFIGTSMSHSKSKAIPQKFCDFTLIGGDLLAQLRLLNRLHLKNKDLYIEGSAYFRENLDLKMIPSALEQPYLISLSSKYKLTNLILGTAYWISPPSSETGKKSSQEKIKKNTMEQLHHAFKTSPYKDRMTHILQEVSTLAKKGHQIHFYFFPILFNDELYQTAIKEFIAVLKANHVETIELSSSNLSSNDGLHFSENDLREFMKTLTKYEKTNLNSTSYIIEEARSL